MDEDKKTDSLHVSDKRRFVADETGAVVAEEGKGQSQTREPFKTPPPSGETQATTGAQEQGVPFPEVDFSTLVLSLSSSAIVHLGLVENPHTGTTERDLSLAKQTIDIIGMLKEKTKGNLTLEEQNLVENLLTDLRLKYVTELKKT